jgi:hypothetical protein
MTPWVRRSFSGIGREKILICSMRPAQKRVRGAKSTYVRGTAFTCRDPSSAAHSASLPICRPRKHTLRATLLLNAVGRLLPRENEEHWRALCRSFEVDYDGVPAALEVTSEALR